MAVSLYKALESLTSFDVQNFNFATEPERLVLTFNLNVTPSPPFLCFVSCFSKVQVTDDQLPLAKKNKQVKDCEQNMNLPNLRLWVTGALLNQGFDVVTPFST